MKRIKKLASLLLAMVMALAMTMTVFAGEVETPSTPPANEPNRVAADLTGHTYTAYQIFAGTQSTDDENKLATITWGNGIDAEAFMKELTDPESKAFGDTNPFVGIKYVANDANDSRTGNTSATEVAKVLEKNYSNTAMAEAFAKIADKHVTNGSATVVEGEKATLPAGYYLVVDTTQNPLPGENPVRNVSVLQLTKEDTFEPETKVDVPEVTKKVKNTDDATNPPTETDWQDHADYDTGDNVPFILTGTLPTDYARYETYKYTFHDKQSDGLNFNNDVVVKVDGTKIESGFTVVTKDLKDGCTFEVRFEDLKTVTENANSIITVEYTAELTAEAIPSADGITNSVKLEYSNNSNSNGEGDTGTTPEDVVTVFTYKVVANKTDENSDPLTGAAFTLYKYVDRAYVEVEVLDAGTEFSFKGIDAGQYKLAETQVPAGYNRAEDIEFKVVPVYDETVETPTLKELKLTDLAGNAISGEDGDFTINVGTATTNIQNLRGSLLPSTGGIGTTIFYVVGGILVVAAGILLVTKKRMSVR